MNKLPDEYKSIIKILLHQIKSYGEERAFFIVHVDSDGTYDFNEGINIGSKYPFHLVKLNEKLELFITKITDELINEYNTDNGMRIIFNFNANNNKLEVDVDQYYWDSEYDSTSYTFDELREKMNNFDDVINQYKHLGQTIAITYEGGGDSGWIDDNITGFDGTTEKLEGPFYEEFLELLYEIISSNFGDWGNDDGGNGSIYIYPKQETLNIEHTTNITSTNTITDVFVMDLTY